MAKRITAEDLLLALFEETVSTTKCLSGSCVTMGGHPTTLQWCTGPGQPPRSMQTCHLCWNMWRVKLYFQRKAKKDGEQLQLTL